MNEEQAVLDFFAKEENLPLALVVAEQMDSIRRRMNNDFWRVLGTQFEANAPAWQVQLTEDRNMEDCLVGLHLKPVQEQALFLRPMMEQQVIGEAPRIYFGLMWSDPPPPDRLALPQVAALGDALRGAGFRSNEKFLGWQWSPYYPRSRQFLLRLSTDATSLLDEASALLNQLLMVHGPLLEAANAALRESPQPATISLDALRAGLKQR